MFSIQEMINQVLIIEFIELPLILFWWNLAGLCQRFLHVKITDKPYVIMFAI
jgi:hypothetical protein